MLIKTLGFFFFYGFDEQKMDFEVCSITFFAKGCEILPAVGVKMQIMRDNAITGSSF